MNQPHLPWLELAIAIPLVGAGWVGLVGDANRARKWFLLFSSAALACALAAWWDFISLKNGSFQTWSPVAGLLGPEFVVMDDLNAPLLSLSALLFVLTALSKSRTNVRHFSFAWMLLSETLLLALLACREPWGVIALLAAGTVPPLIELRARHRPIGVFVAHMVVFVGLLVLGWTCMELNGNKGVPTWYAILFLTLAIAIRSGLAPFHCWMPDLFEHASFGTAMLFVAPMPGAYAAMRLLFPIAPSWVLSGIGVLALVTAFYSAGMALVQSEARRFFCYLFLSHSALVLVGMDTPGSFGAIPQATGLTGALCVWLSVGLALSGFGQVLRALEARHGRLSLKGYHGLYEHTPALAVCFLLTGLASVGFPGTFGFLGTELLVDGAVEGYPYVGVAVVLVSALNGIAVVKAYFLLFTGKRHVSAVPLGIGFRERLGVLTLVLLILAGGLYPQPGVASRWRAARYLLEVCAGMRTWKAGEVSGPARLLRALGGTGRQRPTRGERSRAFHGLKPCDRAACRLDQPRLQQLLSYPGKGTPEGQV